MKMLTLIALTMISVSVAQTCADNPMIKYIEEVVEPFMSENDNGSDGALLKVLTASIKKNSPADLGSAAPCAEGTIAKSCCTTSDLSAIKNLIKNIQKNSIKTAKGHSRLVHQTTKILDKQGKKCMGNGKKPNFDFMKGTDKEKKLEKEEARNRLNKGRINRGALCFLCSDPSTVSANVEITGGDIKTFKIKANQTNMEKFIENCSNFYLAIKDDISTLKADMDKALDDALDADKVKSGACQKIQQRLKEGFTKGTTIECTDEASCKTLCQNKANFLVEPETELIATEDLATATRMLNVSASSNISVVASGGVQLNNEDASDSLTTDSGETVTNQDVASSFVSISLFVTLIGLFFI